MKSYQWVDIKAGGLVFNSLVILDGFRETNLRQMFLFLRYFL